MIRTPFLHLGIAIAVASFLLAQAPAARAVEVIISDDVTQNGGVYEVDPADGLFVTDMVNDPLFTLTNGATTAGIEGFVVGEADGETGRLLVEGGSVLTNEGSGAWTTIGPVILQRGRGYLGLLEGSFGEATITGPDSQWINAGRIYVGEFGNGALTIEDGGVVSSALVFVGTREGTVGSVTVSGAGSRLETLLGDTTQERQFQVGDLGSGTLLVEDGGVVSTYAPLIGAKGGGVGEATVTGVGSQMNSISETHVGFQGKGTLTVANGGTVSSVGGYIGTYQTGTPVPGGDGHVVIRDAGSAWNVGEPAVGTSFAVGWQRLGLLEIENGGTVTSRSSAIGGETSQGNGTVTVTGTGSTWTVDGDLALGGSAFATPTAASGTLTIANGGTVEVSGSTIIHTNNPSTINLQSGGTFIVNVFDPSGGTFNWTGGSLVMTGDFQGDLGVTTQATLGGTGAVQGNLTNAGLVSPGLSPGTLSVTGDFTQDADGETLFEIGGLDAGVDYDVLDVGGAVSLDGVISVALISAFNPQLGDSFSVLSFDSFLDNGFAFDLSLAPLGSGLAWDTSLFSTSGNLVVVPEPTGPIMVGLGGLVMAILWRRRRWPCGTPFPRPTEPW
jgi:T5SS/PEP-CTERM-associated repeat protein